MSNQITFTKEELKQLKDISSITELSNRINNKTDKQFSLVQTILVEDLNTRLLDNNLCINKLNEYFFNNWKEIIKLNKDVTDKWQKELKSFKAD